MVTALTMIRYDLSGVTAIVAGLLAGLLVAAVNTVLIVVARVPDLVATLGTLFIFQGLALIITSGKSVSIGMPIGDGNVATGQFAPWYRELGNGEVLSIPVPVLFLFVLAVLTYVFLAHTRWGRAMYAIGGNAAAARLAGIPVQRYRAARLRHLRACSRRSGASFCQLVSAAATSAPATPICCRPCRRR